jgi:hypothetical protein
MPFTATVAQPAGASHCSWPATITTACASLILVPFAYSQFGPVGAGVIAAFAVATIASVWIGSLISAAIAVHHPMLSAVASSSGIRMLAPLVVALAIVVSKGSLAPIETVYYVVPLYLCSLAADVVAWIREVRPHSTVALHVDVNPVASGEAG